MSKTVLSIIHSTKFLMSIFYLPGTVPSPGNMAVNQKDKNSYIYEAYLLMGKTCNKQVSNSIK